MSLFLTASCSEETKKLAIVISSMSINGDTTPSIVGYFVYENNGIEYKEDIKFEEGVGAKNLKGSSINKVFVRKASGTGAYRLTILEDLKVVFQTEMSRDESPIIYIKP